MKTYEAVIIGGGVSGMACGKTLHEEGIDFILLTKEIGGRMLTSKSHAVNYGASYITSDYEHIIQTMGGGEAIKTSDCYFHHGDCPISFYRWRTLLELPKLVRLYFIASDFRKRLKRLRKQALYRQQKDILADDPVLRNYVNMPAGKFVSENKLEYLNDMYFGPLFNSTAFIEYELGNAFDYLNNLMALFCKTYVADHSRCCRLLPKGWRDKIAICEVDALYKNNHGGYSVETANEVYQTKNIVLALPYKNAIEIYKVPEPKHNIPIYVLEVSGERNECCKNKQVVFFQPKSNDITILWKQVTGTDVIFSKVPEPELEKYYLSHKIINSIYWETAVVLSGAKWSKQILDEGLYLASDYNICGLEDAYITGVYAANQIIKGLS
ncbi:MAG: NAD(P)-binding protein [bacterium]|nr:NAD(P)-binding protein [bacterium]